MHMRKSRVVLSVVIIIISILSLIYMGSGYVYGYIRGMKNIKEEAFEEIEDIYKADMVMAIYDKEQYKAKVYTLNDDGVMKLFSGVWNDYYSYSDSYSIDGEWVQKTFYKADFKSGDCLRKINKAYKCNVEESDKEDMFRLAEEMYSNQKELYLDEEQMGKNATEGEQFYYIR